MATIKPIRFTQARLAALAPTEREYVVRDTQQPGLQCRVQPGGQKTLEIRKRPAGSHKVARVKIGPVGALPLTGENSVRTRAHAILSDMLAGINPNEIERLSKAKCRARDLTLGDALDDYLEDAAHGEKPMKASTVERYRREVRVHFGDWIDLPLAELINNTIITFRPYVIAHSGIYQLGGNSDTVFLFPYTPL